MKASLLHLRLFFLGLLLTTVCCSSKAVAQTNLPEALARTNSSYASSLTTNVPAPAPATLQLNPSMTDIGGTMVRLFGALALVIGIFLGGVWLFRNWQRLTIHRGQAPKLNVLETRSLGGRHALYVVGYENERFLVSSSPSGINLLTHLPTAETNSDSENPVKPQPAFASTLAQMLKGK